MAPGTRHSIATTGIASPDPVNMSGTIATTGRHATQDAATVASVSKNSCSSIAVFGYPACNALAISILRMQTDANPNAIAMTNINSGAYRVMRASKSAGPGICDPSMVLIRLIFACGVSLLPLVPAEAELAAAPTPDSASARMETRSRLSIPSGTGHARTRQVS